jgi:cell division septation protein DedD
MHKEEIPQWIVQAGAFADYQNAQNMVKKLKQYGVQSIIKKI